MEKELKRLYTWSIFGGSIITSLSRKGYYFNLTLGVNHLDFVEHVESTLQALSISYKKTYYERRSTQIYLNTVSSNLIKEIKSKLYVKDHKTLDPVLLDMLDEEMLADMIVLEGMGTRHKKTGYVLYLYEFSYGDVNTLKEYLKSVFNIDSTINRSVYGYKLVMPKRNNRAITQLINPYVLPSFQYKIIK